jgi:hypothetical protein
VSGSAQDAVERDAEAEQSPVLLRGPLEEGTRVGVDGGQHSPRLGVEEGALRCLAQRRTLLEVSAVDFTCKGDVWR